MSYDKNMEELLVSARQSPTELSYDEVEFLFLNPTPPPPAKLPTKYEDASAWWRGGSTKFLIMLAIIVTIIGLLLPTPTTVADYQLSAFPVREETPAYTPVDALTSTVELAALPSPKVEFIAPQVRVDALKTNPAPAAAPPAPVATETAVEQPAEPVRTVPQTRQNDRELKALFSGSYQEDKNTLTLTYANATEVPVDILSVDLTEEEQKHIKNRSATLSLKRAAGSLLLYPDGKKGRFEFLLDEDYRAKMTARNWGATSLPENGMFVRITSGKENDISIASERKTDQLWFRYFTTDIDQSYTDLLKRYGYTDEDLADLWQLANFQIDRSQLKSLLEVVSAVLTDQPPLTDLWLLKTDELDRLQREDKRMTYAEYRELQKLKRDQKKARINKLDDLTPAERDEMARAKKQEEDLNFSLQRPGSTRFELAYKPGEQLLLNGTFEYRINKDLKPEQVVVFGPKKVVNQMKRRSDKKGLQLINKNKRQPLYVEFPLGIHVTLQDLNGTTTTIKMKMNR